MVAQAKDVVHTINNRRDALLKWYVIDDVVMGGQSSSSVKATDDNKLIFAGKLSTIGGGFCSCRTHEDPAIASAPKVGGGDGDGGGGTRLGLPPRAVSAMIQGAIQRGVPEWNSGNQSRCTAIYMEACTELATSDPRLAAAVTVAAGQDAATGGWTLRNAMDSVLQSVASGHPLSNTVSPAAIPSATSTATSVEVAYVSDMQRYKLTISAGGEGARRGLTWAHYLPVEPGHHRLMLPLSDFKASVRGRPMFGAALDPAEIRTFGITCSIFDEAGKAIPGAEGGDFAFLLEDVHLV